MTKLTPQERDKLDNTCGNLRVTKLGTHVKSLEDFVNEMQLDTMSDTVAEAINELYHMIVDKDCEDVQIPPPGFFTLWGNDEDGKLYVYYNNEDHPPLFRHVETPGEDEGTLYLYIADPEGENHYEMEIGHYIAVRHLNDYYTKTEIQNGYATINHGHGNINKDGKVGTSANVPLITGTGGLVKAGSFGNSANTFCEGNDSRLSDARTPTSHAHGNISNDGKVGTSANVPLITGTGGVVQAGSFGTGQNNFARGNHGHSDLASINYVDQQIANIDAEIEVDFASKANKSGYAANKNIVTDSNGEITTEAKITVDTALNANSTNPVQNKKVKEAIDAINGGSIKLNANSNSSVEDAISTKVDKVTGKGLSANDFTNTLKNKLDAIEAEANKYTHPSTHATIMIIEASALGNIGSSANDNQHTVNDKINTALGNKVDKVNGKSLVDNSEITKLGHVEDYANKTVIDNTLGSDSTTNALSAAQGKALDNKINSLYARDRVTDDYYIRLIRTKSDGTLYDSDSNETWEGTQLQVNTNDKLNIQVFSRYGNTVSGLTVTLIMNMVNGNTVRLGKTTNSNGRLDVSDSITLGNNQDGVAYAILKGTSAHQKVTDIAYVTYN